MIGGDPLNAGIGFQFRRSSAIFTMNYSEPVWISRRIRWNGISVSALAGRLSLPRTHFF